MGIVQQRSKACVTWQGSHRTDCAHHLKQKLKALRQCRCCGFVVLKHQSRSESVLITFKQNIVGENSVNRLLASSESWIHFSRGGELSLDDKSLFTKFSPNVIRTLTGSLNVIGASAQQNHNISTDLGAHSISFERMDCEIIFVDRSKYNVHRSH
ncbi:hypothetical protein Bca52824_012659 [Brassica carinata]|uniref:Uncharacterized protein n=1 Tax=Brassica carinata TaxID=52824 RepID=A0A8X7VX89_BRACI|nr:hypothetical protein Bca52824_012659 [Brassica carinata]